MARMCTELTEKEISEFAYGLSSAHDTACDIPCLFREDMFPAPSVVKTNFPPVVEEKNIDLINSYQGRLSKRLKRSDDSLAATVSDSDCSDDESASENTRMKNSNSAAASGLFSITASSKKQPRASDIAEADTKGDQKKEPGNTPT